MRVWFLKETKSICTSCATGCNTMIGTREDVIYRQTPRENDHVNSCWMCDYGRLNYKYLESDDRLLEPQIRSEGRLVPADWPTAIGQAALQLKQFAGSEIAIVASGRMTNEELWLTAQLASSLGVKWIDIVPRRGQADHILLSKDRNPNTNGARLILGSTLRARRKTDGHCRRGKIRRNQGVGDFERERDAPGPVGRRTCATASPDRDEYFALTQRRKMRPLSFPRAVLPKNVAQWSTARAGCNA